MRILIVLSAAAALSVRAADFPLVEDGRARCAIVLPPKAEAGETWAALELADYLEKITGARPEIRSRRPAGHYGVFLGVRGKVSHPLVDRHIGRVKDDGFLIVAAPEGLFVVGSRPRAVCYGAYEILKRYGDVRWIHPTESGEHVPARPAFAVPEQVTVVNPSFVRRRFNLVCANIRTARETELWQLRNNMVSDCLDGPRAAGGHVFSTLLPDVYFPEHPEYYGLYQGRRLPQVGEIRADPKAYGAGGQANQPCTSNPDVIRLMGRQLVLMAARAGAESFTLLNNDSTAWCGCGHCRGLDPEAERARGLVGTRYWTLVNRLVAAGKADLPGLEFAVSAYQTFQEPPLGIAPDPRVAIDFCLHHRCYTHSLGDTACAVNERFRAINRSWRDLDLPVSTYEYTDCLPMGTVFYLPLEGVVARDLKYYKSLGNEGYCDETPPLDGVYAASYGRAWTESWRANFLVRYVQAFFLWDADADLEAVLEDVGSKFYGKAWPDMKAYRTRLRAAYEENPGHFIYGTPRHALGECLQQPGILEQLKVALARAAAAVADDARLAERVRKEQEYFALSWEEQYAVFRQQHGAPAEAVRRAGPIVLDGRLEEADWQRAPAVSDFRIFLNQEQKPKAESRVRLLYDDDALYLAAEALEPRPDRMVTAVTAHDGPVWQDNNFEFFFAPPGLSPRYVHWVVNAAGAVYDALTVSPQDSDVTHRLDAEFKTAVKGDRWIVEVRVPFAALGGRPGPGEVWKINVARGRNLEDGDGNELSSWSAGAVHGAEGYRRVVFQPADPRPVAGAEGTP